MKVITGTRKIELNRAVAVAIGKFDGLHLGHQKLLQEILEQKRNGMESCVFTFDPAPSVFFGASDGRELLTREEKRDILAHMGVDVLIEFPLTAQTASIPPKEFATEILAKQMHVKFIAAGTDLSFGAGGKGNAALLQDLEDECGFEVKIIEKIQLLGREISSTYVREQLEAGNMPVVAKLLGRPYSIKGTVVHGNRLGRSLGMPTVNLSPPEGKLMPPCGVYYSSVLHQGKRYRSISNVGYKPTVAEKKVMGVETYLYDFDSDVYGEEIEVSLYEFKRPEKKFENIDELKAQLMEDISAGAGRFC